MTTTPTRPGGVGPVAFRQALGRFATGVTVITTVRSGPDGADVHGMTANAFTSVSLSPPLVLVSVATAAHLQPRIQQTGRYGVSVLGDHQEPLARHFAGSECHPEQVRFVWRDGLPFVVDALVHLACTVDASHPAGDHTLHVGHVDGLWLADGDPLLYWTGGLRSLRP